MWVARCGSRTGQSPRTAAAMLPTGPSGTWASTLASRASRYWVCPRCRRSPHGSPTGVTPNNLGCMLHVGWQAMTGPAERASQLQPASWLRLNPCLDPVASYAGQLSSRMQRAHAACMLQALTERVGQRQAAWAWYSDITVHPTAPCTFHTAGTDMQRLGLVQRGKAAAAPQPRPSV